MIKLLRLVPVLLVALALAGGQFTYRNSTGTLTMQATSGILNQMPNKPSTFDLRGGVTATSKSKGITMTADRVAGETVQVAKEAKISHATATGGVRVVKTTTSGGSTLNAGKADYTDRGGDVLVVLTTAVRITNSNSAKRESVVITGPHGEAILDPMKSGRAKTGLRTATMDGGVRVQIDQSTGGNIVATGRRLVLDNLAHTITLTGGVQIRGSDKSGFGSLQNAERAILRLDEKGNVIGTEVRS